MSGKSETIFDHEDAELLAFRLEVQGIDDEERVAAALCRTAVRLGVPAVAALRGEDMLANPYDTTETVLARYRDEASCNRRAAAWSDYD